jgi:hydroxyacylglutathione hydrolase
MFTLSFFTGGIAQTNGYLLLNEHGAIAVDAPEGMAAWVAKQGVPLTALLLTHQHFDHVMDAAELARTHHCPVYAFAPYSTDLTLEKLYAAFTGAGVTVPPFAVTELLGDQAEFTLLGSSWQALHVPGHSPDSLCFYAKAEHTLLGGDVLFRDGVGRTDFPGGSWETLLQGIEQKLLPLPDATQVYPGHGPATTIGRERSANPFLLDP